MKKLLFLLLIIFNKQTDAQIINTIAGTGTDGFSGDGGQAIFADLFHPIGLVFDGIGNLYISDLKNNRIRKVAPNGIITTFAGNGTAGYSGDGGQATLAQLHFPNGMAFDALGNMLLADEYNHCIRKIDASGIITTIAGTGISGFGGDGGQATLAKLNYPVSVHLDALGNILITDQFNSRIRKIDLFGIITTFAGSAGVSGFSGDGGAATSAKLNYPNGVLFDGSGNTYICDGLNNRIRKVNSSGIISTIVGTGTAGYSGDGGQAALAELNYPAWIIFDPSYNMYIVDADNNRIRKVNSSGIITTIVGIGTGAGTYTCCYSGDGGIANFAEINCPREITFDANGNLYIADFDNSRVRMISNVTNINQISQFNSILVYPNPVSDQFYIETNSTEKIIVDLYDLNGQHIFNKIVSDKSKIDVTMLSNGIYSLTIKTVDCIVNKKLVIVH